MKKKILNEVERNSIITYYQSNQSISLIAATLHIDKSRIRLFLKNNNLIKKRESKRKIFFNEIELNKILNYYENNLSCDKISKIYNVSKKTIERVLKENSVLKEGYSNGIKIALTNEQKELIKDLYLNGHKNSFEISKTLALSQPFISKYLSSGGFRRTKGEATSITRKGKPLSEETKLKLSIINKRYAMSGNRVQKGGICKTYYVENIKCTGTYEKFYIEKLLNEKIELPINSRMIKTPLGAYYPDFEYYDNYIEIKSDYTYDVLIGVKENKFTKKISTLQYEKIRWVNKNIKPVHILIIDKKNNRVIKKEIK